MKGHTPRLSIGLPVYNGERYLAQVLDDLLAQTFADFEIIVNDNASTDRTPEICASRIKRDPRVRYFRNTRNVGAINNFNRVFHLSKAPLFKWVASDDVHRPTYLQEAIAILDRNEDVILAHSACAFIDQGGDQFAYDHRTSSYLDPYTGVFQKPDSTCIGESHNPLVRFWQVVTHARWGTHMFGIVRRDILAKTSLLLNFAGSDRAMLAELSLLGRFQSTNSVLYLKRFHEQGSWALTQKELKTFLSPGGCEYSRRARQLKAFFSACRRKPINVAIKTACVGIVAAHCARVGLQTVRQKEAKNAAQGAVWRAKSKTVT